MSAKQLILFIPFCFVFFATDAQQINFKDSVAAYNMQRIHTNKKGMKVLTAWGIANIAAGGVGYFTARQDEWKYFHEMNELWGVVNTGIGIMGLAGTKKEMAAQLTYDKAYDRYLANKKLYLINAGLDVVYIGTGVALDAIGNGTKTNADIYKGFGTSFVVQGIFLLCFDNIMYASHVRNHGKWFQLMNEIRVTGRGVGFVHQF